MNDMQTILEDASYLVAESRFAKYLVEDVQPVPETNPNDDDKDKDKDKDNKDSHTTTTNNTDSNKADDNKDTSNNDSGTNDTNKDKDNTDKDGDKDKADNNKPQQHQPGKLSDQVIGQHDKPASTNVIPEDQQEKIEFSKNDLKDINKVKKIEAKVKRTKNVNMAKTIFRSALSIGAISVGMFTAAPMALVSATTVTINLLLSMHGVKKDNELANMQLLLDKKNSELQKEYLMERDPKKKAEMKEYMDAVNAATLKVKSARGK